MIDPHAAEVLAAMRAEAEPMPQDQAAWLAGYRAQLAALVRWQGPPAPIGPVHRPGIAGGTPPLRLYRPDRDGPLPTLLFIHGGGFVAGTLDAYDIPLGWLALWSGWRVAAVDYRLAPEHPYPAAPDDCLAALQALAAGSDTAGRLAVAGDSAGGLLACVTARRARAAGIALERQILLYPNADLRMDAAYKSRTAYDGTVIRMAELARSLDLYAGAASRDDPELSPVLADGWAGMAPALVVTNECDPLRDEGEALAGAIPGAVLRREPGMIHGAIQYQAAVPAGEALLRMVAAVLQE